jgi:1-acyl-sn-glycerol-3-phosphate acyltransferase
MTVTMRSLRIWIFTVALILLWLPMLAVIRMFDRDPVRYRTGLFFRRLGIAITRANPLWRLEVSGEKITDPRRPYVVVSNHQSFADIPLISHLPWEMKWVAKIELFRLPVIGWMLKLAADIPVHRQDKRAAAQAFIKAARYIQQKCSVMFFPEGTRSPDGMVHRFTDGAFALAIKYNVPILPLVVEGSRDCLPKKSWKFGNPQDIKLRVLSPVETTGMTTADTAALRDKVRRMIMEQIAAWRRVDVTAVDGGHLQKGT